MRVPRVRLENEYWPIVARAVILAFCGVLTFVKIPEASAVLPAILLLLVGAVATVPLPERVPTWLRPLAESIAAALVVGLLPGKTDYFVPYLLVPLTTAGLTAGLTAALLTAATSAVVLAITSTLAAPVGAHGERFEPTFWFPLLVATALVSAWTRRVTQAEQAVEPAYADAHRLLSELHVVARQLSLGLDPQTLAAALVDELKVTLHGANATVLVRSSGGRFVPLVGEPPSQLAESVVIDAWVSADLVRRGRNGVTVVALPVQMGERVVAVVVLSDDQHPDVLDPATVEECRSAIAKAGPRLASALLFDDVRRLATNDERNRLAREIHDGIAQDLASVGYMIDNISTDADTDTAGRLTELRNHVRSLVADLRLSIFDLRAGIDESVGLGRTLGDYVQRVGAQADLIVHVSTDEAPTRLPIATEVEMLRIVQEAVTNVRRHADANNLWLTVTVDPPAAHIVVSDDGKGLGKPRPDSMGITGMKERASRIGAHLTVRPRAEGRGTSVEVLLEPSYANARLTENITGEGGSRLMADSTRGTAATGRLTGGGST